MTIASPIARPIARPIASPLGGSGGGGPVAINLITKSEDFTGVDWIKAQSSTTSNAIQGPSVEPNGSVLLVNAVSAGHAITDRYGVDVTVGQSYVTSIYAKAKDFNYLALLQTGPNAGKYFDILNGTVLGNLVAAPDSAGIEDVGDGWFRCWIAKAMTASPHKIQIYVANTATTFAFAGTTVEGIYVAGVQVEPGVLPGPYKKN